MSNTAIPGQRLAIADGKLQAGSGCYVRDGSIFASIFGNWCISQEVVEVTRINKTIASAQVLRLGDIVICRVVRITTRQVMVDIICASETVLRESFPGTIRLEDVRTHDTDKLVMEEIFSPGILVKAAVLSFGDTRSYFLSTAKPGLGVVRHFMEKTIDLNKEYVAE
ncbi:nucleic acid-ob-fold-like protein [Plasmopara halstedii]|uniref:Nucleic acid-ob-fold-like protein n=1 Tax=Plasmopara halstedii TaxID=4781 RepID=A0A0P1AY00_PLAHL|nr:nucleic acid-ob-fold-like protein [Plasmopara halstedii]CEG46421.1 nucleic acid-ob-fold-like protein [Plasmopara halstedii]|eukprot:XP_024582790.1 nucleic acid-ob-fold-like protein [Plasmopara halstedii]